MRSVRGQLVPPAAHLIEIDWPPDGFVKVCNRLAAQVETEYLMVLPDDDLIDVTHIQTLLENTAPGGNEADVVYSWCRTTGRDGWVPNSDFDATSWVRSSRC